MAEIVFRWEPTPYHRHSGSMLCDVEGGRLLVRRVRPGARSFDVLWNGRHIGMGFTIQEAKAIAERLYSDGVL